MSSILLKPNLLIIVDDSSFDLKINSAIAGHTRLFKQILCFQSAEAALDFLSENLNNPNIYPHLILLDIYMPEMNGFEFIDQYKKFPDSLKEKSRITMLSSSDDLSDVTRAKANKLVSKVLRKPLQIEELKNFVSLHYQI
ncbi:MAG: response regulator [Niabella sp.]